jgi:hypothetical protein
VWWFGQLLDEVQWRGLQRSAGQKYDLDGICGAVSGELVFLDDNGSNGFTLVAGAG